MAYPIRALRLLTMLLIGSYVYDSRHLASAQSSQYVAVTSETLQALAQKLKQDLQDGAILLANLHAVQLRLALRGVLREEMSASISALEQHPEPDRNQPKLTAGLVPVADKLIAELYEPNRGLALKYAEQLAIQVHAQNELFLRQAAKVSSAANGAPNSYENLSSRLHESLLSGDIASAVVLAAEVGSVEDSLTARNIRPPFKGETTYDINDALGRESFLRQDYLSAGDYLLKAADTPGSPVLRSFGPDLWLAKALLQAGYRDIVLTFLERCRAFWPKPALDKWISVVKDGGSPDFFPNVRSHEPILSH